LQYNDFMDAQNASPKDNYTSVPNELIRNKHISGKAKALLCLLISNKKGWKSYKTQMQTYMKEGREAIESGLKELEAHQYLKRYQVRKNSKICGSIWAYTHTPNNFNEDEMLKRMNSKGYELRLIQSKNTGLPSYRKPVDVKPDVEKHDTKKTIDKKTNNKKTNKEIPYGRKKKKTSGMNNHGNGTVSYPDSFSQQERFIEILKNKKIQKPEKNEKFRFGDVDNFKDKACRFGYKKLKAGEYPGAWEAIHSLPDSDEHKQLCLAYVEHESAKWDFSATKNKDVVPKIFCLEYILDAPNAKHFLACYFDGTLQEDLDKYYKRNNIKRKQEYPELKDDDDGAGLLDAWDAIEE